MKTMATAVTKRMPAVIGVGILSGNFWTGSSDDRQLRECIACVGCPRPENSTSNEEQVGATQEFRVSEILASSSKHACMIFITK